MAEQRNFNRYEPGEHPNSKANLKPYVPGQSGNPKGRPPGTTPYKRLVERLQEQPERLEELAKVFEENLAAGDPAFWRLFLERSDSPKTVTEHQFSQLNESITLIPRPPAPPILDMPTKPATPIDYPLEGEATA